MTSIGILIFGALAVFYLSQDFETAFAQEPTENFVSWPFFEWLTAKLMEEQAGAPDHSVLTNMAGIRAVSEKMPDGATIRGYSLYASGKLDKQSNICVLALPGDAELSCELIKKLNPLRDFGADVYSYDYRGFGDSEGEFSLNKTVADARQLLLKLDSHGYKQKCLYGICFGGIVLLDAVTNSSAFDAIIIDSTPASNWLLTDEAQPKSRLPLDCKNFLLIAGKLDRQVRRSDTQPLLELGARRGAATWTPDTLGHPFDPKRSESDTLERLNYIIGFIKAKTTESMNSAQTNMSMPNRTNLNDTGR